MISDHENEISSTRISSMAASTSNDNLGLTATIHREKDTQEGSEVESLTAHNNKETAPNQVAISVVCSSPALFLNNYALNKDKGADTGNNSTEVILKCPHCSTVCESPSEVVIHIREKHLDEITEGRLQCRSLGGPLHCTGKESNSGSSSSNSFMSSNNQETSLKSIQCSSCGTTFGCKWSLKRHLSRFPHCRER